MTVQADERVVDLLRGTSRLRGSLRGGAPGVSGGDLRRPGRAGPVAARESPPGDRLCDREGDATLARTRVLDRLRRVGSAPGRPRRRNLAGLPVEIHVAPFEEWEAPAESFDLVYAATSWHWLDPAVCYRKAHCCCGLTASSPSGVPATPSRPTSTPSSPRSSRSTTSSAKAMTANCRRRRPSSFRTVRVELEAERSLRGRRSQALPLGDRLLGAAVHRPPEHVLGAHRHGRHEARTSVPRDPSADPSPSDPTDQASLADAPACRTPEGRRCVTQVRAPLRVTRSQILAFRRRGRGARRATAERPGGRCGGRRGPDYRTACRGQPCSPCTRGSTESRRLPGRIPRSRSSGALGTSAYVVAKDDFALFSLARLPDDAKGRLRAEQHRRAGARPARRQAA